MSGNLILTFPGFHYLGATQQAWETRSQTDRQLLSTPTAHSSHRGAARGAQGPAPLHTENIKSPWRPHTGTAFLNCCSENSNRQQGLRAAKLVKPEGLAAVDSGQAEAMPCLLWWKLGWECLEMSCSGTHPAPPPYLTLPQTSVRVLVGSKGIILKCVCGGGSIFACTLGTQTWNTFLKGF